MQITHKLLPQSRIEYTVVVDEPETAEFFTEAINRLSSSVKIAGFRPGKAPAELVRGQLEPGALREEAYSLAAQRAWSKIAEENTVLPIEDPKVEVEAFEEGKEGKIVFSFDVRPEVKLGDWKKIKISNEKTQAITKQEVDDVVESLARANATTVVKISPGGQGASAKAGELEPAEMGDKLEVSFTGSVGGVRKDRLEAKKFAVTLGQGGVVPGFEENLIGVKRGDVKKFSVKFPKEHFDKDLANKDVDFEVTIDEVYRLILPERDDKFASQFGHKKYDELLAAVEEDLQKHKEDDLLVQKKAKWLAEFEQKVATDVPQSLIDAEVGRSRQSWSSFLTERNLSAKDWLDRRGFTMEKLEEDWRKAASSSVKIGLGLSEVAKSLGKELKSDADYQALLDQLVSGELNS